MGWLTLCLAFAAFFASHSVPLRPQLRAHLVARLGARGFSFAYSALSLVMLTWLVRAARNAPFVPLWDPSIWLTRLTIIMMLIVCVLLSLTIGRPNPFSFGGRHNETFNPERPGIVRLTRHPILLCLTLWACAHILANGDLAHVILFGTFAGFAQIGMRIINRRKVRESGPDLNAIWQEACTTPLHAALLLERSTLLRIALGVALFGGLFVLHPLVIGTGIEWGP